MAGNTALVTVLRTIFVLTVHSCDFRHLLLLPLVGEGVVKLKIGALCRVCRGIRRGHNVVNEQGDGRVAGDGG
jgi:hypothetical protein